MSDVRMECEACHAPRESAAASFCSKCGRQFISLREVSEIELARYELLKIPAMSMNHLALLMAIDVALAWVLGGKVSPIDAMKKVTADVENKLRKE